MLVIQTKLVTETKRDHDDNEPSQLHSPLSHVEDNYFDDEVDLQRKLHILGWFYLCKFRCNYGHYRSYLLHNAITGRNFRFVRSAGPNPILTPQRMAREWMAKHQQ